MNTVSNFALVGLALASCGLALVGCADSPLETSPSEQELSLRPIGYHVIKLDGLGGTTSNGNSINNFGIVAGVSNLAGDGVTHATVWIAGIPFDLGSAGGPTTNSAVVWPVKNVRGIVSGITEVPGDDPNDEAWSCAAFIPKTPGHICRGFVWERGEMRTLPTLGGTHSFATGTNNRRQTIGWAETAFRDPSCNQVDQFLQFHAVVWGPGRGDVRALPPLDGDSTSAATVINDHGDIAGISGACANAVGGESAAHAVLWRRNGSVVDLGSLGGVAWNTPMAMNNAGDIVGFANAAGTSPPTRFNYRPFVWTHGAGMHDLGTLPDDARGQALGINSRRQIVGFSRGAGFRGVIWDHGAPVDLNERIVSGSRDTITVAGDINDLGVITGTAVDSDGVSSTFVAIPVFRGG